MTECRDCCFLWSWVVAVLLLRALHDVRVVVPRRGGEPCCSFPLTW